MYVSSYNFKFVFPIILMFDILMLFSVLTICRYCCTLYEQLMSLKIITTGNVDILTPQNGQTNIQRVLYYILNLLSICSMAVNQMSKTPLYWSFYTNNSYLFIKTK